METPSAINARTVKVPRIQDRDFEVEVEARADGGEGQVRLYPVSFSSEVPVRRFSWDTFEEYDEVLSHATGDVDLTRAKNGLPLIKSHQRLLHFGDRRNRDFGRQHVVKHMIVAQIGVRQHIVPDPLTGA